MPKLLQRDGRLIVRSDGRLARDCDPDCCEPQECDTFARMTPCGSESPDPACTIPPGKGELYVCTRLFCSTDNTEWPHRPEQGIYHGGVCWRWNRSDPTFTRAQIPPGAQVIDSGLVECILCTDPRCGPLYYAEAVPCDPNYSGPRPLFCPAGLVWECNAIRLTLPSGYIGCFEFRRDAPTNPYPANTPVYYFGDGAGIPLRDCCRCNCTTPDVIPADYCADVYPSGFPGGCCPTPTAITNGQAIVLATMLEDYRPTGFNFTRLNTWEGTGPPDNFTITQTLIDTLDGVAQPPFVTIYDNCRMNTCPVARPVLPDGNPFFVTPAVIPQPPSRTRCLHNRTFDTYYAGVSWTESDGATRDLDINLRLIASDRPECRNGCGGVPLPAVGGGDRSIATNPSNTAAMTAWMRQHYGGCSGCGQPEVPI
jgi:hypothetical protein